MWTHFQKDANYQTIWKKFKTKRTTNVENAEIEEEQLKMVNTEHTGNEHSHIKLGYTLGWTWLKG